MAISIRERIRKKDISSGILLFEETASLLFPFFVLFRKETRAAKVARERQARSVLLFVRCKKKKEKKGERKGMREKVTSSRVSRIVQILSLLYATTIIFYAIRNLIQNG